MCLGEGTLRMSTGHLVQVRTLHYNLNASKWCNPHHAGCVHKLLPVICYSELSSYLSFTQSFSYPELPTPLLMLFSLSGMPSLQFPLIPPHLIWYRSSESQLKSNLHFWCPSKKQVLTWTLYYSLMPLIPLSLASWLSECIISLPYWKFLEGRDHISSWSTPPVPNRGTRQFWVSLLNKGITIKTC